MKPLSLIALGAVLACCLSGASAIIGVQGQSASPDVVITSPPESIISVEDAELMVRAAVLSYGVPLTDVVATLNGEKVFSKSYALPQGRDQIEFKINLRPGDNVLSVTAANKVGLSAPAVRKISYASRADAGKPNLFVLAIGVGKYKSPTMNLTFARRDAEEVTRALNAQGGGRLFQRVETKLLLDEQATRDGVLDGLSWLNDKGHHARDVRVVFVSGMVNEVDDTDYLLPPLSDDADASPVKDLRVGTIWEALAAVPGPAIVFADIPIGEIRLSKSFTKGRGSLKMGMRGPYFKADNVSSFIAAIEDEKPLAGLEWGHSAFTKSLLDGLAGKADSSGDGCIDLGELSNWLDLNVTRLTKEKQNVFSIVQLKSKSVGLSCRAQ
jgi:hypothetical protein